MLQSSKWAQAMTSVISPYILPILITFSAFSNLPAILWYPSRGGQGYPTTRFGRPESITSRKRSQTRFGRPESINSRKRSTTLAKTTNNLCDGHRLYNHTQQSYAQSYVQPASWYYMLYSSIHNIYPIFG